MATRRQSAARAGFRRIPAAVLRVAPSLQRVLSRVNPALRYRYYIRFLRLAHGRGAAPAAAERRGAVERDLPAGLNVIGYARAESGVGEDCRMSALAAERAGLPVVVVNFAQGAVASQNDAGADRHLATGAPYRTNLLSINADQMEQAALAVGADLLRGRYNIGYWRWELDEFPDCWKDSFQYVDEIWAPSRFVQEAIAEKSPVPVVRMPHPVHFEPPVGFTRASFGLPADRFLFLFVCDLDSFVARKNPQACVDAFQEAFPADSERVGLVIKTMNGQRHPDGRQALSRRTEGDPRIHFIDRVMNRNEVLGLQQACDCFLSLHRAEGFGRGIAESMLLGKPVVATDYSGNTDFMNGANSCPVNYRLVTIERDHGPYRAGQHWAEPDVEHAAHFMRRLVEDESFRARIGMEAEKYMRGHHSPEAIGRRYARRLRALDLL